MNPSIGNILAVIAGIIVGGAVNMGIIVLSPALVAPPVGVDPTDMESLKSNMHLFEAWHFIMPFLAHALGTLAGAREAGGLMGRNMGRQNGANGCKLRHFLQLKCLHYLY